MPTRTQPSDLVSLQQASKLLGVHPSTVRSWADQGKLKAVRTAGGHRRFSAKEIRAFALRQGASHDAPNAQLIIHSALGRTRMELTGGNPAAHPWFQLYDEARRERHREMGRKLLGLTMHYLNAQDNPTQAAKIVREARRLGGEYGRLAAKHGLSLANAMRAFLFFRDFLLESVVQMHGVVSGAGEDALASFRLINTFANEVLIAMVSAYQES